MTREELREFVTVLEKKLTRDEMVKFQEALDFNGDALYEEVSNRVKKVYVKRTKVLEKKKCPHCSDGTVVKYEFEEGIIASGCDKCGYCE